MGVHGTLHAWKVICGTLGNQKGWNRRKLSAKFSCPQTLPHWALSLPFSFLHTSRTCLSFLMYVIYFYSPLPCSLLYRSKSLWQDTEAHARPLGAAGRVCGRKGAASTGLCYLLLAAQHQAGTWPMEVSPGSDEQPRPAGQPWGVPGEVQQGGLPPLPPHFLWPAYFAAQSLSWCLWHSNVLSSEVSN